MKYEFKLFNPAEWTINPETLEAFDRKALLFSLTKEQAEYAVRIWVANGYEGTPPFSVFRIPEGEGL